MLKPLYKLLVFILPLLISCSAKNIKSNKNDTVFLAKASEKGYGYKVFIEPNRNSDAYRELLNFAFDSNETASFKEYSLDLKTRYPAPLKKYNIGNMPKEWLPVYSYKGKYYLYAPDESGNEGRRTITDTAIIYQWLDGIIPQPILETTKPDKSSWLFKTDAFATTVVDPNHPSPAPQETLIIHVIDPKTMLSIWEEFSQLRGHNYYLYAPKKHADKFDMVVSRSVGGLAPEFAFDKIDYKALLKGK